LNRFLRYLTLQRLRDFIPSGVGATPGDVRVLDLCREFGSIGRARRVTDVQRVGRGADAVNGGADQTWLAVVESGTREADVSQGDSSWDAY
jgi:hypothetical protein